MISQKLLRRQAAGNPIKVGWVGAGRWIARDLPTPAIVVDERHRKALAVVVALFDGPAMSAETKGTMAKTIHHVGDTLWALEV